VSKALSPPEFQNGVLERLDNTILALLDELKRGIINRILEKSDFELGLEVLLGKRKRKL